MATSSGGNTIHEFSCTQPEHRPNYRQALKSPDLNIIALTFQMPPTHQRCGGFLKACDTTLSSIVLTPIPVLPIQV